MFVKSYGLFWQVDEVDWSPGKGKPFRLLGHRGINRPGLRLADFRGQTGIYILYNNYGPYYVGLTRKIRLGKRLKDHLTDQHTGRWTRFSWFGFRRVLRTTDEYGMCGLAKMAEINLGTSHAVITDVEALLIRAMGLPSNVAHTAFTSAEEWHQVKRDQVALLMSRVV